MADMQKDVQEVVEDLKKRIEDITNAGKALDSESMSKINDIKKKAISVLTQASNKIVETANSFPDPKDMQRAIEIVNIKSRELYDNCLRKINEISNSQVVNDAKSEAKEIIKSAKDDISEFFEKEEVKNAINSAKTETVIIAEKALETLKNWLKTEDK